MHRRCRFVVRILASAAVLSAFLGCADRVGSPPVPAMIVIDVQPDELSATWELTGPGGFREYGVGDREVRRLDPGRYTITWETGLAWTSPDQRSVNLTEGGYVRMQGTYRLTTPEAAMLAFRLAYGDRNLDRYAATLSPTFRFVPPEDPPYRCDAELAIASLMFSGKPGHYGTRVANIAIDRFTTEAGARPSLWTTAATEAGERPTTWISASSWWTIRTATECAVRSSASPFPSASSAPTTTASPPCSTGRTNARTSSTRRGGPSSTCSSSNGPGEGTAPIERWSWPHASAGPGTARPGAC